MKARKNGSARACPLGPAERGRIVQKIMVEGWTAAEAAAGLEVDERVVQRWVEDYRRRGMASLRESRAPGFSLLFLFARLRERVFASLRREPRKPPPPVAIPPSLFKGLSEKRNF